MKIVVAILVFSLLSSCWPISVSLQDKGSMPESWKTFTIKTLEINAANCPLSYGASLTEKLKDGVQNNTRLALNTSLGKGEVNIEGIISNYNVMPLAIQGNDNASQNRLSISVQFSILVSEPKEETINLTATRFADFNSSINLSSVESELVDEISTQIVQDVINKLLNNW
jgi:hypothetical protein